MMLSLLLQEVLRTVGRRLARGSPAPAVGSDDDGEATATSWTPVSCKRLLLMKSDVTSVTQRRFFLHIVMETCAFLKVKILTKFIQRFSQIQVNYTWCCEEEEEEHLLLLEKVL